MNRFLVAAHFVWDEYPALRVGRLYQGLPDVSRSPRGDTHVVEGPDATETLCGLPRTSFPHTFPDPTHLTAADLCATCATAAG